MVDSNAVMEIFFMVNRLAVYRNAEIEPIKAYTNFNEVDMDSRDGAGNLDRLANVKAFWIMSQKYEDITYKPELFRL